MVGVGVTGNGGVAFAGAMVGGGVKELLLRGLAEGGKSSR